MASEYDSLLEEEPKESEYDQLLAPELKQEGGIVQAVVSEAKALSGQALHTVNPINLVRGVLDIQPRSGLQDVLRAGRMLRDIVGGAGIGETIRKEAPEVAQQQEAILGKHGPEAQRETLSGIGTQLGMVAAPFLHGKVVPLRGESSLRETAFGKAPEAAPETPVVEQAATEPVAAEPIAPPVQERVAPATGSTLTETLFGKQEAPLVDQVNAELDALETGGINARQISEPTRTAQPEVRTPVGEGAPLRQQWETAQAREGIEEGAQAAQTEVGDLWYSGVGPEGETTWVTSNLEKAKIYAQRRGEGGRIHVYTPEQIGETAFADQEGNLMSPREYARTQSQDTTLQVPPQAEGQPLPKPTQVLDANGNPIQAAQDAVAPTRLPERIVAKDESTVALADQQKGYIANSVPEGTQVRKDGVLYQKTQDGWEKQSFDLDERGQPIPETESWDRYWIPGDNRGSLADLGGANVERWGRPTAPVSLPTEQLPLKPPTKLEQMREAALSTILTPAERVRAQKLIKAEEAKQVLGEPETVVAPKVVGTGEPLIFGYTFDQIKSAQQGGRLVDAIRGSPVKPKATEADYALLEKHGLEGLQDKQFFGVLDRLGLPMEKPASVPTDVAADTVSGKPKEVAVSLEKEPVAPNLPTGTGEASTLTRKQFREHLNKTYPFDPNSPMFKGSSGKLGPTKRDYGDYLWSRDREMFENDYQQFIKEQKAPPVPETPVSDTASSIQKTEVAAEPVTPEPPPTPVEPITPPAPQKPSKIGQSIEAKAVEAKLTKGFAETAGYDPLTIADQSQRATDLIKSSVPQARAIIRGEAPLPEGLRGTSLITAMEEQLLRKPDAQVAYELANSPLTSATSAAAQEMRLMAERVPDGIAAKFTEIKRARTEGAKLRGETPEKINSDITKEIVKQSSKRPTWEQFVREIIC